uniref:Probable flavin-containing monooxygenase 1 n=1 Tax=Tanacetum cinerariifolium TaxID=118510 RepID=A0A699I4A1_TANCI|nr:probable flavin-containing monooxygenase 1 [Tanacetum cinerariifolium]
MIKFNHKVVAIDYSPPLDNYEISQWDEWSGNGKWKMLVQNTLYPLEPPKVYEVDFVILCSGNYSDFPNVPQFPMDKGPEVFDGVALHSMDYAMMSTDNAAEFIKDKRVTLIPLRDFIIIQRWRIINSHHLMIKLNHTYEIKMVFVVWWTQWSGEPIHHLWSPVTRIPLDGNLSPSNACMQAGH